MEALKDGFIQATGLLVWTNNIIPLHTYTLGLTCFGFNEQREKHWNEDKQKDKYECSSCVMSQSVFFIYFKELEVSMFSFCR